MKIYSIIVCYNPNINTLGNLCSNLLIQNSKIILIDNSEETILDGLVREDVELYHQDNNIGIAAAQNIGLSHALKNNADILIFFDQDSVITNGFIEALAYPINKHEAIVTSPVFFDSKTGFRFPSYRLSNRGCLKEYIQEKDEYLVDLIISSGMATNRKTINLVGNMNENYFIDFVDLEWSLRCKALKVPIYAVPEAKMFHSIGESSINLFFFRVFIHNPKRTYYKVRNSLLFFRNQNVPILFGAKEILSAVIFNLIALFFVENKIIFFRYFLLGIAHGLIGKIGKVLK